MAELDSNPEENTDPFHPDNVHAVTLITLLQIRDIMAGILQGTNPAGYSQIREAHKRGDLVLEPPFLMPQGEGEVE